MSLQTFLLEYGQGKLDINLFDFTASRGDVTSPSQVKPRRRRKKHAHADGPQGEDAPQILEPPPSKSKRDASPLRSPKEDITNSTGDDEHIELVPLSEVQGASLVGEVSQQRSPQKVGLLREKLLRLAPQPTNQQNTEVVLKDPQAPVPTVNVEPATESENEDEGEEERGGDELQIHSSGDNSLKSDVEADADSRRDVKEEVLLPDIACGSRTPARDSQNSKRDPHRLTACERISATSFSLNLLLCSTFPYSFFQLVFFISAHYAVQ